MNISVRVLGLRAREIAHERTNMKVYKTTLRGGIRPTPEFAKKGLAQFAVNTGTKCGHDCLYCSTGSLVLMHRSFRTAHESPFSFGYAIVDPDTPERVARDARRLRSRGLVQLCTIVDAWAPEARSINSAGIAWKRSSLSRAGPREFSPRTPR